MSFGQSFQITPVIMLRAAAAIVNGGKLVTPHFAVKAAGADGETVQEFCYETVTDAITEETSNTMKDILRQVVEDGGGKNAYIEGFSIGGKSVDNPRVIAMCLIDEPQGVYYGGTIAAPVIRELFENILPYLEIYPN